MTKILVTGGAGYIGSNMCKHLDERGYTPIVLDNLVTGHHQAVKWGPFVEGSMGDTALLNQIFKEYKPRAVMHFAAFCYVSESVNHPSRYYRNNVTGTMNLIDAMVTSNIPYLIFSSSCATYGNPMELPMTEDHPQHPINPYGWSKLMVEQILADMKKAHGLEYTSLRYFNAAGADPEGELGEDHTPETHLIPLILQTALGQRDVIQVFGDDYPTVDGTCIRDYIHINDIAQAHLLALERLLNNHPGDIYNLGNGNGYSVKQIIDAAQAVTGKKISIKKALRREGDPSTLISSSQKARDILGWKPEYPDIHDIIRTAWEWHQRHPHGYEKNN